MSRFTLALVTMLTLPAAVFADAAKEFLQTPIWYLSYEVSFSASSKGSYEGMFGPMTYTASLERVFTHSQILNLRSEGPGALAMIPPSASSSGSQMSMAEAQKASMDMMARMEHTANWMVGGASLNASEADATAATQADIAASMGQLRIDFTRHDRGDALVNEVGSKFSTTKTETVKGTTPSMGGGFGSIMLDVDTSTKTFLLGFGAGGGADGLDRNVVEVVTFQGQAPEEKRETKKSSAQFAQLVFDESGPVAMQGGLVVNGTFDPASKTITGEKAYRGHYHDGNADAPGTIVVKYTLSPTPPAKKAGGK